jgi:hypothetical protein
MVEENKTKLNILIYILGYDNETLNNATALFGSYKWAKIIILPATLLFENYMYDKWLIEHYDEWKDYDFVGTLSWRARDKVMLPDMDKLAVFLKNNEVFEVVPFLVIDSVDHLNDIDRRQPLNNIILKRLFEKLGFPDNYMKNYFIQFYANYWITKPKIMLEYIQFFHKCKEIIDSDDEIQKHIWKYVEYNSTLDDANIKKIFGRPSFSSHPFVYERIPFLYLNRYRILHPGFSYENGLYPSNTENDHKNNNERFNTSIKLWIGKHLSSCFSINLKKIKISYDVKEYIIDF